MVLVLKVQFSNYVICYTTYLGFAGEKNVDVDLHTRKMRKRERRVEKSKKIFLDQDRKTLGNNW